MKTRMRNRAMLLVAAMVIITAASLRLQADTGTCGGVSTTVPFTDVMSSPFFCQIAEAYFSALTNGTDATHYSPSANVPREQMAAFVTRTLDQSLRRGSLRAALKQWWTPTSADGIALTSLSPSTGPLWVESDGADLWVSNNITGTVSRVRASDGKPLETWTGANQPFGLVVAKGRIFIVGRTTPGTLYQIDPTQPAGAVTTVTSSLGSVPDVVAFDGARVWTANEQGAPGSVSIVTLNPVTVTTVSTGFFQPIGILYDGTNIWVVDNGDNKLKKLDSNGNILLSANLGSTPRNPVYDGTNIWVPNVGSNSITVVRASSGAVLATLTGNGMNQPIAMAFDGERILVVNNNGNSVSLWKASDLTPLGNVSTGSAGPLAACSDGVHFWITLNSANLGRF
jgi:hypothetical protein